MHKTPPSKLAHANARLSGGTRLAFIACLLAGSLNFAQADDHLVVHEWGTFTCMQDETGRGIGGINTDDEPVPEFVHDISPGLIFPPTDPALNSKGAPRCHQDVTMRLETPVVYFYPAPDLTAPFDVEVKFHGGWLTQYFPDAAATAPGVYRDHFGPIKPGTTSSLEWKNITLKPIADGPATQSRIWLAPRRVNAAPLEVNGEREKFLFYRGVAKNEAPLQVVRAGPELTITSRDRNLEIDRLWLADIRPDGSCAFRLLRPFNREIAFLVRTPADFQPGDYAPENGESLRAALRAALNEAGLFLDEAEAMLETWEVSYFQNPGLRLFFLLPQKWTDGVMPLKVSRPGDCSCPGATPSNKPVPPPLLAEITRVMVGRIELLTPEQRDLLGKISAAGEESFALYEKLGRFRNAVLLDEQRRRPSPMLETFIRRYQLQGYAPTHR